MTGGFDVSEKRTEHHVLCWGMCLIMKTLSALDIKEVSPPKKEGPWTKIKWSTRSHIHRIATNVY